jgi:hypothetical protein
MDGVNEYSKPAKVGKESVLKLSPLSPLPKEQILQARQAHENGQKGGIPYTAVNFAWSAPRQGMGLQIYERDYGKTFGVEALKINS